MIIKFRNRQETGEDNDKQWIISLIFSDSSVWVVF
jgi:hypothetical protein